MDATNQAIHWEARTTDDSRNLLVNLSENVFSGKTSELANALGRGTDEIHDILNYEEEVDDELFAKIHHLSQEFNLLDLNAPPTGGKKAEGI